MVEEIIPGVWRIPVPLPNNPLKELNAYLIRGEGRSLLIDTGFRMPECRAALLAGLEACGGRGEVLDIALTHLHSDHSGLAPELVSPEGRVYVSAADRVMLESYGREETWRRSDDRFLREGFPGDLLLQSRFVNPARALSPGECGQYADLWPGQKLRVGRYTLECVFTPGHTPGHMCFWMEQEGVMFLGDHVLFDITPNITSWAGVPDSLGNYLRSLDLIRGYPIRVPLPAHRGVMGDVAARVDALKAHHDERLRETLTVVRHRPGATAYEIAGNMTWRIRARSWEEFPLAQKWFAVGEALAHLERLMALGQVERRENGKVGTYFAI